MFCFAKQKLLITSDNSVYAATASLTASLRPYYSFQSQHRIHANVMHRNSRTAENNKKVDVFFVARQWQGEPQNKEPHKCDDLSWF
ncbi:hypothetical protein COW86_05335 [Candidatus Kuenenbacteria bacterium CG22_combo_CG10-13_8_21_14_all_39_9]|uniref:Uncharacterized protein n=1 Tax=Candidatus Kuenenbacteria bacterium CG22_combo_CG10-13_8_21_14_all_39_9 TaxID=1974621 RepID=A0A2H0CZ33_9BACT|nr:MAG: hypothetical protein COW86_05335 [Candidatus Kuenenbacteria bacterium CG22_combo_CG10-13_8_21_14_all_39_9]